ncbi:MAG: hypothetical protein JW760_12340 [Spirochaetales bacterium]|nr:hypothetical protein [Spirochaetales bacterium]
MDFMLNLPPIALGAIIFGIVLYMALIRHIETKHLSEKYSPSEMILASFGVTYFGRESEIKKPKRIMGALVLVKDGIYFRSRYKNIEVYVPKDSITLVGTTDFFCDKPLNDTVIQISFKNESGSLDRVAFRIPAPAKWLNTVQKAFLGR